VLKRTKVLKKTTATHKRVVTVETRNGLIEEKRRDLCLSRVVTSMDIATFTMNPRVIATTVTVTVMAMINIVTRTRNGFLLRDA